jgi:hypothetical protein
VKAKSELRAAGIPDWFFEQFIDDSADLVKWAWYLRTGRRLGLSNDLSAPAHRWTDADSWFLARLAAWVRQHERDDWLLALGLTERVLLASALPSLLEDRRPEDDDLPRLVPLDRLTERSPRGPNAPAPPTPFVHRGDQAA